MQKIYVYIYTYIRIHVPQSIDAAEEYTILSITEKTVPAIVKLRPQICHEPTGCLIVGFMPWSSMALIMPNKWILTSLLYFLDQFPTHKFNLHCSSFMKKRLTFVSDPKTGNWSEPLSQLSVRNTRTPLAKTSTWK